MGVCLSARVDTKYEMEKVDRTIGLEISLGGGPSHLPVGPPASHSAKLDKRASSSIGGFADGLGMVERRASFAGGASDPGRSASGQLGTMAASGNSSFSKSNAFHIKVNSVHQWILKDAVIPNHLVENIEDVRVLGRGLMGTVRLAKWRYMEKDLYLAMKSVNKEYVLKHNDLRHVNNERDILRIMSSPFIIKLFGTCQDDENIYYMLEYSAGGELFHRLMRKKSFPAEVSKFYAAEIFLALEHVQASGFVYRDLKPENVMLDANGHCKLVDFGFSRAPNRHGQCSTNCGTPAYLSPEQLNGKFTNGYTKAVDWWSLGCLIYELMTGLTPFCKKIEDSAYEIYMRVLKGSIRFSGSFDGETKDLIKQLLKSDIKQRLIYPERIKSAPYFNFKQCSWADVESRKVRAPFVPKIKNEGDDYYFGDARSDRNPRKPFKRNQGVSCANYFQGF